MAITGDVDIIEIKGESDGYSDNDVFDIKSWGADLTFRDLITRYEEDELEKPELQRKYVWDKKKASRFIESILMGLPVPSIFLAKTSDEIMLIIDGYQRIMSVFDYVNGIFSKDKTVFKLSNSDDINIKWRNKSFKELEASDQRRIRNTTIHAIIFQQIHPNDDTSTSMFQIFERINTGGEFLKPQEVRNCVYQGSFNSLLIALNKGHLWRDMFGSEMEDSRMNDIELILRFFTLAEFNYSASSKQQINLKKELNLCMGKYKNISELEINLMKLKFEKVIQFLHHKIGRNAFRNISAEDGKYITRFHPTIYDAVSIATLMTMQKNIELIEKEDIIDRHKELLKDDDFKNWTSNRTTNIENILGRINLAAEYLYDCNLGLKVEEQ